MNLETLYAKKRKLYISSKKITQKIERASNKEILKNNKILRRERDHHLLMLGLLMEKANIDNISINTLLGFFLDFKNLSIIQEEKLKKTGTTLLSKISNKDRSKEVELLNMTTLERKARAHRLISIGALLEIPNIDKLDKALLLGYFLDLHNRTEIQKQHYYETGSVTLIQRQNIKKEQTRHGKENY